MPEKAPQNGKEFEVSAESQADELPNISDDEIQLESQDKEVLASNKTEESIIIDDDDLYGENVGLISGSNFNDFPPSGDINS